jgi:hypothetical protein
MDYQRIYDELMERAKGRKITGYFERHHIIPHSMGGKKKENIVKLTAREHYIAHWLLSRIHPNSKEMAYAFFCMCNMKSKNHERDYKISSRAYSEAREKYSKLSRTISDDDYEEIRRLVILGVRISEIAKKYNTSHQFIYKKRNENGWVFSDINDFYLGSEKYQTLVNDKSLRVRKENKNKNSGLGKQWEIEKVKCPKCNKIGGSNAMRRYHFENCNFTTEKNTKEKKEKRKPGFQKGNTHGFKKGNKNAEGHGAPKGNKNAAKPKRKMECPHCKKIGGSNAIKRWHLDNCKFRILP